MFGVSIRLGPFRQFLFAILLLAILFFYMGWTPFHRSNKKQISLNELLKASLKAVERGGFQVKLTHDKAALKVSSKGKTKEGANDPLTDADLKSHYAITQSLIDDFGKGTLKIISEEHSYEDSVPSLSFDDFSPKELTSLPLDDEMVSNDDVVIWVDPLDATQEYTENLLEFVTVMVCVAVKGSPVIGVIYKPFEKETYWAWKGIGKSANLNTPGVDLSKSNVLNLIVSRSHAGQVRDTAQSAFGSNTNIISAGGAGYKVLKVVEGAVNAYVHVTLIKKWDICAGNAILNTLGGNMTTLTGESIKYGSQDDEKNELGLLATMFNHERYLKGLQKLNEKH